MKLSSSVPAQPPPVGIGPGIFPYLGASVPAGQLRAAVRACGGAIVPGKQGAKLAADIPGVLIDPAEYASQTRTGPPTLFDYDDWLMRQRSAEVPLILTDTPRIENKDQSALHKALARWDEIAEPTLVVLPIQPWWLKEGLPVLIEEVRSAGRPVAVVLLAPFNGLDAKGAVAGLLTFISAVEPLPVILLRSDISAVGAVAHQAFAGFVGWSTSTRHGFIPMRRRLKGDEEQDNSPSIFVPALNNYAKTSKLPVFARIRRLDVLRCDDLVCRGDSLLEIAEASEIDPQNGRRLASIHDMASTELLARRVLTSADPPRAWWKACQAGKATIDSLAESGVSWPQSRWLSQWLELVPSTQDYQPAG